jgi:hypothetical protein
MDGDLVIDLSYTEIMMGLFLVVSSGKQTLFKFFDSVYTKQMFIIILFLHCFINIF